jgi:hypothetical protein
MGTWGPGNFDSDGARDYLAKLLKKLVDEIEEGFNLEEDPDDFLDEYGEYAVMPAIDIYATLGEKYGAYFVDEEMAARWRSSYLQAFDDATFIHPQDFKPERRKAVVETFDRLDALIASWRKRSS